MARKLDLGKAKKGDKIRFRCGADNLIKDITVREGGNGIAFYRVKFADGDSAEFGADGTVASDLTRRGEKYAYEPMGADYDIVSCRHARKNASKKPLSLSRAFNLASRSPGSQHSRHLSLQFARANHLRGIAGRYHIPGGVTAGMLEDVMSGRLHAAVEAEARKRGVRLDDFWAVANTMPPPAFLVESWNSLVALNPALDKVKPDMTLTEDIYNAHIGVTSGFNVDDIRFFLEQKHVGEGLPARQARNMPDHGDRLRRIESVSNGQIYWVVSPETAKKIEQRFKRRGLL